MPLESAIVFAFLENLGTTELLVIMVIALVLFGNRLPEVARSFGKGLAEFKRSMRESTEQVTREFEAAAGPMREATRDMRQEIERAAAETEKEPVSPEVERLNAGKPAHEVPKEESKPEVDTADKPAEAAKEA